MNNDYPYKIGKLYKATYLHDIANIPHDESGFVIYPEKRTTLVKGETFVLVKIIKIINRRPMFVILTKDGLLGTIYETYPVAGMVDANG